MDRLDARILTMCDHGDQDNLSLLRFNALWESSYRHDSVLIYNTGRSPDLYKALRNERPILTPDITITSVGTAIAYGQDMVPDDDWFRQLDKNWDRNVVLEETAKFPELVPQPGREQGPHKISFDIPKEKAQKVIKPLYASLTNRGLDVKIIRSCGTALDVLPKEAGKGQALKYILKKFGSIGKPPKNTLVCGDSGNDAEMFTVEGVYGFMVGNSSEELLRWYEENENAVSNSKIIHAAEKCASGIIEAVRHFQLGPSVSPRDMKSTFPNEDNKRPAYFMVNLYVLYETWRRAEAEKSEAIIQTLKSISHSTGVIVHPSGSEHSIHRSIDALDSCHGDKREDLSGFGWIRFLFLQLGWMPGL